MPRKIIMVKRPSSRSLKVNLKSEIKVEFLEGYITSTIQELSEIFRLSEKEININIRNPHEENKN